MADRGALLQYVTIIHNNLLAQTTFGLDVGYKNDHQVPFNVTYLGENQYSTWDDVQHPDKRLV